MNSGVWNRLFRANWRGRSDLGILRPGALIVAENQRSGANAKGQNQKGDPAKRIRLFQGSFPAAIFHHGRPSQRSCALSAISTVETRRPLATATPCHSGLFADAKVAENDVQHVLDVDAAGEAAERRGRGPQLLGQQVLLAAQPGL